MFGEYFGNILLSLLYGTYILDNMTAELVPIAIPEIDFRNISLNKNILYLRTISRSSVRILMLKCIFLHGINSSRYALTVFIVSFISMFEYMPAASGNTNLYLVPGCNLILWISSSNSKTSLILDFIWIFWSWTSIHLEATSGRLPHFDRIGRNFHFPSLFLPLCNLGAP